MISYICFNKNEFYKSLLLIKRSRHRRPLHTEEEEKRKRQGRRTEGKPTDRLLPSSARRLLQSTQWHQQLLGSNKSLSRGRRGEGKIHHLQEQKIQDEVIFPRRFSNNSRLVRLSSLFFLTFSMLRSFICKTRSSTGLRVISASENRLKSPKTADEYSLQKHDGNRDMYDYEGEKKNSVITSSRRL